MDKKSQKHHLRFVMLDFTKAAILVAASLFSSMSLAAEKKCIQEAVEAAPKLIEFHFGKLDGFRIEIEKDSAKKLPPLRNPVDSKEYLEVVEVWGTIYKGNYRTRFIFSTKGSYCLLVGQEILEIARF